MAETWNDDRLNELSLRVEDGFDRVDRQLHALRTETRTDSAALRADLKAEMQAGFEAIDKRFEAIDKRFEANDNRFEAIDKRFEAIDNRLDALYRVLLVAVSSMLFTVIGTAIAMVIRG